MDFRVVIFLFSELSFHPLPRLICKEVSVVGVPVIRVLFYPL